MAGKISPPKTADNMIAKSSRYIEGVVRGYRNSLLTGQNYSNLTQCENIDGIGSLDIYYFLAN